MFRIGTRKSELALVQSRWVQAELEKVGVEGELVLIESHGDRELKKPLYEIETSGPGLFTKQLEEALLRNEIDLAVHSLKDLPTQQPAGLRVAAVPAREVVSDVLICLPGRAGKGSLPLPAGARVGTSSLRREALLKSERADLVVTPLRGNVPTRLRAVTDKKLDATVLAAAGLKRLGLDLSGFQVIPLPEDRFIPAPGQGALAIEVRTDCPEALLHGLARLHDEKTALATALERRILRELEGGCTLPLGVRCLPAGSGGELNIRSFLGICPPLTSGARAWLAFERFDISGDAPETLVGKTVDYFRACQKRYGV